MDSFGNLSLLGRTATIWRGQRSPAALKFFQDFESMYLSKHMESISKGKDLPCIAGFEFLKSQLPSPEHQSFDALEQLILFHQEDIALADQGLLGSKGLTADQRSFVFKYHSAGINSQAAIDTFMEPWFDVYDGFAEKGLVVGTAAEQHEILAKGIIGRDWQAFQAGRQPEPGEEIGGLALYLATVTQQAPAGLDTAAAAGWAKRREIQQQAEIKEIIEGRPIVVLTASRRHTAHSALLLRIVALMRVIYGPGDENQYQELMTLRRPGAQGDLTIPEFAARIEQLHTAIRLTNHGVEKIAHISVFNEGLNEANTRAFARTFCDNKQWNVTLREVMEEACKYEQNSRDLQLLDMRQSALMQRAAGRKQAAGSSGTSSSSGGALISELSSRLASQQQQIERMPAGERAVIYAAYEWAKEAPNNPNAICVQCPSRNKPHINAACRNRNRGDSSEGKAHGNLAQQYEQPMQALLSRVQALESSQQLSISSYAPYGFAPALAAAAAGPPASGLPRAYNKPEGGSRFKGKGSSQSGAGCPTCGFGPGHPDGAVCYLEQPAAAPDRWPDPSDKSPKHGVVTYIKRALQAGKQLRLGRCAELASEVMPQLTPQEQQKDPHEPACTDDVPLLGVIGQRFKLSIQDLEEGMLDAGCCEAGWKECAASNVGFAAYAAEHPAKQAIPGSTAAPETWQVGVKYLFEPQLPNHLSKQQERQSLDRLTGTTRATGITLTISDGRSFRRRRHSYPH